MNVEEMIDEMRAKHQRERVETQMTLGDLISALRALPDGAKVLNLSEAHSYRGYYSDLAFEPGDGLRPASDLLADCREAMGKCFHGYKGGEFVMCADTPLWIARHGRCGEKILGLRDDGGFDTQADD